MRRLLDGQGVEDRVGGGVAAVGPVHAFHNGVALPLAGGDDDDLPLAGEGGAAEVGVEIGRASCRERV